jgi:ATP-dependent RNA helicase SUPV3L1/SUV3
LLHQTDYFDRTTMMDLQPYIQLFTDFLLKNFNNEIEAGKGLRNVTDLTKPEQWFPDARLMKRKIVYHMGATNSGKTKNAIDALANAKNGIYLAPLRLLAWEVHETLTNRGKVCNLMTG